MTEKTTDKVFGELLTKLERQRSPKGIGRELSRALAKLCSARAFVSITPGPDFRESHVEKSYLKRKASLSSLNLAEYPALAKAISGRKHKVLESTKRSGLCGEVHEILDIDRPSRVLLVPFGSEKPYPAGVLLLCQKSSKPPSKATMEAINQAASIARLALRALVLKMKEPKEPAEVQALFFDHATDGLVIIDQKARVVNMNHAFLKLTGFSRRELVGKRYQSFLAQGSKEVGRDYFRKYRKDAIIDRVDLNLLTKSGESKEITLGVARVPSLEDRAMLTIHDISQSRKLERELTRTKDFFENLIKSSPDAIVACDMNGKILIFNEAAEHISGYSSKAVIEGLNVADFYAPGAAKDVMRKLRSRDYGGKGKLETSHYNIVSKDGEEIPINVSAALIYEDGKEAASVGIFQDLRERFAIEQELREAQDKLIESEKERAITELSGATSHELNQPLTSILGYVELIQRKLSVPEGQRKILESLSHEAERMAELVRKIGSITSYKTKSYVGRGRIIDIETSSTGEPRPAVRYENLFLYMRDTVIETDGEHNIVFVNPEAVNVLDYESPDELIGKPLSDIFDYEQEYEEVLKQVKDHGHVTKKLFTARSKLGKKIYMEASGGRVIDREGKSHGLELFCRDVTERFEAESAVRAAKTFSENIIDNAPVGILTVDKDGTILSANRASTVIMGGQNASFVVGQNLFRLDNIKKAGLTDLVRRGLMGERISAPKATINSLTGKSVTVKLEGVPLLKEDGTVTGGVILMEDMTERAEVEELARQQNERLGALGRIMRHAGAGESPDQFLFQVVKDLRSVIDYDFVMVGFIDENANTFLVKTYYISNHKESPMGPKLFELEKVATKTVIKSQKSFKMDRPEDAAPGQDTDFIKELGIKSGICSPIIARGKVIGTLNICSFSEAKYTNSDVELIEQVAHETGHALEHARFLDSLKQQNALLIKHSEQLKLLHSIFTELEVSLPEDEMVNRYISRFKELLPYRHVMIRLVDADTGKLTVAHAGEFPEQAKIAELGLDDILNEALSMGDDIRYIKDLAMEPRYIPELPGAKSAILIPLTFRGGLMGVLKVESHLKAAFGKEDLDLLIILSKELATSLGNTRLYDEAWYLRHYQEELIDNANALILAFDMEGRITTFNKALENLVGICKEAALGTKIMEIMGELGANEEAIEELLALMGGENVSEIEIEFRATDGNKAKVLFTSSYITNPHGEANEIILVGQDMTRMEALELRLVQATKMASMGQMAAGFVHELSNPLTTISSYSQILERTLPENAENERHKIQRINEAVSRIEKLIKSLMSYTRVSDEGKILIEINAIVEKSITFTEYEISKSEVKVHKELGKDLPLVRGIDSQLQQIMVNLITNACHSLSDIKEGILKIRTYARGEDVVIEVSDNGAGIKATHLDKIFDPFFTTKKDGEGTGLGLSIVHEIVRRHRGKINVASIPGKETRVTIKLPRVKQKHGQAST